MTTNNCAIFKIFLKTDGTTEVRKFVVDDASVITSFVFMKEKLQTLFPRLRDSHFKITWRDSDGDDIIIDNDEDLILAFTEMEGPLKTLYVTLISGNSQQFNPSQFMHPQGNIICDVCNNEITTYRYKCLQCFDYDLCAACEHAGHHSHHMMLRTSTPDLPFSRCGRKIYDHFNKAFKKANHMAYRECKRKSKWDGKKKEGCENNGEGTSKQQEQPSQPPQPSCPFEEYVPQFYPLIDVISNVASNAATAAANAATNAAASASAAAQSTQTPENPNAPRSDEENPTNQFIELVRSALSSVFVQPPQQQQQQTNKDATQTPNTTSGNETHNNNPSANAPMESEIDLTGEPMETSSTPNREPGWTVVGAEDSIPIPQQPQYPVLQPTMAPTEPQDPVIAVGLQQLLDMGFSDKQALIALLKRYDGNVREVVKHIFENQ